MQSKKLTKRPSSISMDFNLALGDNTKKIPIAGLNLSKLIQKYVITKS